MRGGGGGEGEEGEKRTGRRGRSSREELMPEMGRCWQEGRRGSLTHWSILHLPGLLREGP